MIVRVVVSHRVELETRGSLDVKTTSQDTVLVPLAVTLVVVFVVFRTTGDDAFENVKLCEKPRSAPVQSLPACSVKARLPLRGVTSNVEPEPEWMVAVSFGSQSCADVVDDVVLTVKHSVALLSLEDK